MSSSVLPMRRLAYKLALVVTLGVAVVHAISGTIRLRREAALFEHDMMLDHAAIGHALSVSMAFTAQRSGADAALDMLDDVNMKTARATIRFIPVLPGDLRVDPRSEIETHDEERELVTEVPVFGPALSGNIEIRESLIPEDEFMRGSLLGIVLGSIGLVILSSGVIFLSGHWLLSRPMGLLLRKVERAGRGDFAGRVALEQSDEIGVLGRAVDDMCERLAELNTQSDRETSAKLAALEQLRHADRLTTVGKLSSGIAHELGTPLAVISARAKMIARKQSVGQEAIDDAEVVVEQADRMTRIIRQLLDFVRVRRPDRRPEELRALCEHTKRMLESTAAKSGVEIRVEDGEEIRAHVDSTQLQQVLTNLVMNAIQAQPSGGSVRLTTEGNGENGLCAISVTDEGEGMTDEVRDRIFEPFFTTKDVGDGTGLGLSVAYGIVREHGGWIEVESERQRGTRFTIHLPKEAA